MSSIACMLSTSAELVLSYVWVRQQIRIQQRNGRKSLTTVQGLPKSFDLKKTLKIVKKEFSCNGSIEEDPSQSS